MADADQPLHGETVGTAHLLGLRETCLVCGADVVVLSELVAVGVANPLGDAPDTWVFSELEVLRVKKALRLRRDLGIEPGGLALVLELLDRIDELQRQLARMAPPGGG